MITLGRFDSSDTQEQSPIDIISYAGLEERPDYLCIDGTFVRAMSVTGYPYTATNGWLDVLLKFDHDIDVSYHIEQVDPVHALSKLKRKITELESTKRDVISRGNILDAEVESPLASAMDLRDRIVRGREKLFQVGIYMLIRAKTLPELDVITSLLESAVVSKLLFTKVAWYRQIDGLQSVLPRGQDLMNLRRNMDSGTVALTFPFASSELLHEKGILYGINKMSSSLVVLDRFSLQNANSITFAQSGSGKSYAAKVEIMRQILHGTQVMVIDPEREYGRLAQTLKGEVIKMSMDGENVINPFDGVDGACTSEHIQDLTELLQLMVGGFSPRERAAVDKALVKVYLKDNRAEPLLEDIFSELHKLGQLNLCDRLEKYIHGSFAHMFNSQTTIQFENSLVIFDIRDIPKTARPIIMHIIAQFIERAAFNDQRKRLLVIDEGWLLLEQPETARFIAGLVRRARKYYLGVSIISQQVHDFLNHEQGMIIAAQSALRILMRQDTTTIGQVVKAFNLSEIERTFLATCERGEALFMADLTHALVKVVASKKEHPLITTDPEETP